MSIAPSTMVRGTGTFTFSTVIATDVVLIGDRTYTFIATVASADDVDVGASDAISAANLVAAINRAAGEGTLYGTGTTVNPYVSASSVGAVVTVTARVPGTAGNGINISSPDSTITEDSGNVGGVIAGAGDLDDYLESMIDEVQLNSEAIMMIVHLTSRSSD